MDKYYVIILFLAGVVTGAALSFLKTLKKHKDNISLGSKLEAAEMMVNESRKQAENKDKEVETLRGRIEALQIEKASAETRADEINKKVLEQKELLDQSKAKLTETFQALSGESLKSNNQAFLELARESLEVILKEAKGNIDQKEESIRNIVKPLEESLNRYEKQINDLEKSRLTAYGNMENQIKSLIDTQQVLQKETGNLVTALRRPEVRGRWGEVTLKRVAELAGMIDHCDYTEQVSIDSDSGKSRPDMVVHLPAEREIVIDSKISLDAYLDAISCDDPDRKNILLKRHAQQMRKHMKDLSGKVYWSQFEKAPEFVVMFIPGEAFLSAAVEQDIALIEDGMERGIIIATPTTLIALLRAIAYGWRQDRLEKNALEISRLGKELFNRFQPFLDHVNKTGSCLAQSVESFNDMIGSLDRRVIVSMKKFRDLGVAGDKEIPEVKQIDKKPVKTDNAPDIN